VQSHPRFRVRLRTWQCGIDYQNKGSWPVFSLASTRELGAAAIRLNNAQERPNKSAAGKPEENRRGRPCNYAILSENCITA
jgi:hypothetical protein